MNRRHSTIEGFRTAFIDSLRSEGHHIAQSLELHRLLSSFHRGRLKNSIHLSKSNLSVVINQLTKKLCKPMKDAEIKYITQMCNIFLLALVSVRGHSECHA